MEGAGDSNECKTEGYTEAPNEILTPNANEEDIKNHLKENYGLKVVDIKRQNGYDDANFHVTVKAEHCNPSIETVASHGYFVKVSNIHDSTKPEGLRAQLSVMRHLKGKGIPTQVTLKSLQGNDFSDIKLVDRKGKDSTHKVAVRTYLEGEILNSATLTSDLLYDVGRFVANVTKSLQDFRDPFYDTFDFLWSMNSFPKVREVISAVKEENKSRVCHEVLDEFDKTIVPLKSEFRKGQVHGDLNEQNILVNMDSGKVKVCGLLDFQDSASTHPIYDLSIMAAYVMMSRDTDVSRPLMPAYVLAGYNSTLKLNDAEQKCFHTLVAARMVMSLAYGAHYFALDPSNEYLLETGKTGWDALLSYWDIPKLELEQKWEAIINTYTP